MEKGKLTLVLLFLVGTIFGQTLKVGGVVLSYNKNTDVMTLLVPVKLMTSEDPDWQKQIRISKEFELSITINGQQVTMSDTFYYACGRHYDRGSHVTYFFPPCDECIYHSFDSESFTLKHPPKGEYILTVSDLCDEKWVTNSRTSSIVIN